MAQYRCYFLSLGGGIVAAEDLDCADDGDAVDAARRLHAASRFGAGGFEVWQRDRKVHVEPAQPRTG